MSLPFNLPILADAPADYDQAWINNQFAEIFKALALLNDGGSVKATRVQITDLPTSATGLLAGTLWNDLGTVKVA